MQWLRDAYIYQYLNMKHKFRLITTLSRFSIIGSCLGIYMQKRMYNVMWSSLIYIIINNYLLFYRIVHKIFPLSSSSASKFYFGFIQIKTPFTIYSEKHPSCFNNPELNSDSSSSVHIRKF